MRPRTILHAAVVLALAAALGQGLLAEDPAYPSIGNSVLARFGEVFVCSVFGLAVAQVSRIRGLLSATSDGWPLFARDVVNYGVLPGIVLGVINYFFFFGYRYSPFVASRFRSISSVLDAMSISFHSAVREEVVFRVFFLSCFLYLLRHALVATRINLSYPISNLLPQILAIIISSLLFAAAHSSYAFSAALVGGFVLGWVYVHGGVESAVAAHFFANFVFYSAAYLS